MPCGRSLMERPCGYLFLVRGGSESALGCFLLLSERWKDMSLAEKKSAEVTDSAAYRLIL